jgi:hypothetical protein
MGDGPGDGNDNKNDPNDKIVFIRQGKRIDPKDLPDIEANYIVGAAGEVPTTDILDPVQIDREIQERTRYVQNQELVKAVSNKASTIDIIDVILLEISEELAHLKFERRKATKEGKNTANYTISRTHSLKSLADLLLKRKEVALNERLDLKSERFQAVFKVWLDFFHNSMEKVGIEPRIIDIVFQQMKKDMVDWEKKMDMAGIDT